MDASTDTETGRRFRFGANWSHFLTVLNDERIDEAEASLKEYLQVDDLSDKRFLDIGSGSGLFSLAARRLGASVHSFDFDTQSVACTEELKRRYFPDDAHWEVEQGSVLDREYLQSLGTFDVVYSWGVLHHTGAMWLGIENAIQLVRTDGGRLFVAIYNDQGLKSHLWWLIKYTYNRLPQLLRMPYVYVVSALTRLLVVIKYTLKLKPMVGIAPILSDDRPRGMSAKYDRVDWIGGFPYEFATVETLTDYFVARGFRPLKIVRNTTLGCHELALQRIPRS